ncbi:methylthioribose kinase-like isoform X2 [Apostichopus japonicus]|uniref:methylthioribose kinase-like isoform X2 n=1 Tax=Stichopus japonicus TaxID=307972 RepID=UPI003AB691BA
MLSVCFRATCSQTAQIQTHRQKEYRLWFLQEDELEFTEVLGGNLNVVIRISSKYNLSKSVFLKYAPRYTKIFGPDMPLDTARNHFEYKALKKCHDICPEYVPQPFYCSQKESLLIMEDLVGYNDMGREVLNGVIEMGTIRDIADFTLKLHKNTHRRKLSREAFTDMINDFQNDGMVNLLDQFFFTKPWQRDDPTNRSSAKVKGLHPLIYENERLLQNVNELREKFLTQQDCLLHGDLHMSSIMTKGRHSKIIDAEFACIGPAGFDIGILLANYLFSYHADRCYPPEDVAGFHKTVILETIYDYFNGMSAFLEEIEFNALISETVGFCGCELIRRLIGIGYVLGFEEKPRAEEACIHLGIKLITQYQEVTTTDALISILGMN